MFCEEGQSHQTLDYFCDVTVNSSTQLAISHARPVSTSKGEMVQKLLCRWWYAMEWPAKEDVKPAPPSYEALEGYPGVFVCVEVCPCGSETPWLDARSALRMWRPVHVSHLFTCLPCIAMSLLECGRGWEMAFCACVDFVDNEEVASVLANFVTALRSRISAKAALQCDLTTVFPRADLFSGVC